MDVVFIRRQQVSGAKRCRKVFHPHNRFNLTQVGQCSIENFISLSLNSIILFHTRHLGLCGYMSKYKQLLQLLYIKLCRYLWESPIPFINRKKKTP
ncbi:hypothetical protein EYC84_005351 [Monilinia fructicola]|uniref:Uncharacterized protein n=1 Tax=Monilinia fructicola TaxID=38448 RepID=A0A5M9K4N6_MONFR|nr:hypothetical protein EYC84_005351 [Monilinia fructicola]